MDQSHRCMLNYFTIIAGAVITIQLLPVLSSVRPLVIVFGILIGEVVLALLLLIIALSISLMLTALLSLLSPSVPNVNITRFRLLPIVAGIELSILGLATIYLSSSVVSGTIISIMPIGIELFSFGMISIALFVEKEGSSCLIRNVPNYAFLLLFLSMLPAAFLITD